MSPLLLVLFLAQADPPDPARAIEDQMVRAIAVAERGVAAVVVSQRKYPTEVPADRPWELGEYEPPATRGFGRRFQPAPAGSDPLNLADPQTAADNTFGSGLLLNADGLVLTAHHLIDGATKIYVRTVGGKGSYANIVATDARSDLAVLKLIAPPDGLTPVKLATVRTGHGPRGEPPSVRRGQWVIGLGHPLAAGAVDAAPSASWGILSNLRRRLATAGSPSTDSKTRPLASFPVLLQTDARITLGCSGGGLFNLDGEAIGLTSSAAGIAGAETSGGYAMPFDAHAHRVIAALAAGREVEYGFLGVTMGGFGIDRNGMNGVTLSGVTRGMPAEQAGLRPGDHVIRIDDQPVLDTDDLFLQVGAALAGSSVRISYLRAGKRLETTVVLAKHRHVLPWIASHKRPANFGLRPDWSSVLVVEQGGSELPAGVLVSELIPGSQAEAKLKPLGDVAGKWLVTAVDGRPVTTPAAFVAATKDRSTVRLRLYDPARDQSQEVTVP